MMKEKNAVSRNNVGLFFYEIIFIVLKYVKLNVLSELVLCI